MATQVSSFFIRPPRQTYYQHDLGPQLFPINSKHNSKTGMGMRRDFHILNNRNLKINASLYQPQANASEKCLIYLHTHHGSRIQATYLIEPMLNANINLCLFDFSGYGNSEGDTVTLGIQEAEDIRVVLDYLCSNAQQTNFILWGRSMGAVASLLFLSKLEDTQRFCMSAAIFDSPFHSLYNLALEIGSKHFGIPQPFLRPIIYLLKCSLQSQLNFQQLQLQPMVMSIKTPGVFIASKLDKFVCYSHSQKLYNKYGGTKQLIYIDKDHNEPRKQQDLTQVFSFIYKKMSVPTKKQKQNGYFKLISNHLKFIEQHKLTAQLKDYFDRDWPLLETEPMTARIQYHKLHQNKSGNLNSKIFSEKVSPANRMAKTARVREFEKKNKFSKFKINLK